MSNVASIITTLGMEGWRVNHAKYDIASKTTHNKCHTMNISYFERDGFYALASSKCSLKESYEYGGCVIPITSGHGEPNLLITTDDIGSFIPRVRYVKKREGKAGIL